ncbi:MAG TPA: hypothetical protein VET65_05080 [Candidatus Limnocylindrales bacterium]|nr:hypothetical protein [Candidatus Limnocylindrales bacterium]
MRLRSVFVLSILILALSACQSTPASSPTANPTAATRPHSTATLAIVTPQPAATVTTTTLDVRFDLQGGKIVTQTSTNLTPDEGHIHLSIDGKLISMNYQLEQTVSLQAFAPGPHVLQGEFVAKDHAPFSPRVITKLIFEYQPPGS